MMKISVRDATTADFDTITSLMNNELGYSLDEERFHQRLSRMLAHPDHRIYVAEADGAAAGFVGFFRCMEYELDEDYLRLAALAVKKDYWRQGVGSAMLEKVEAYARELGIHHFELDSHLDRLGAHAFYEANGYKRFSMAFRKDIDNA